MSEATRKRMKKEEREQQIIEAARKVFIEKGYKGATTIEIAQVAEISEVTLFRYFSSKQELFMQAIEPILTAPLEEAIVVSNGLDNMARLKKVLEERIRFISENRDLIKLILMESQLQNELPAINLIGRIIDLLEGLIKEMNLPSTKKDVVIRMLMGTILSYLFMPEENEKNIEMMIEQLVHSICRTM
ncbi:MAG: TetR/AcrR family transcriptional regulator [Tepidibacillus sp.]